MAPARIDRPRLLASVSLAIVTAFAALVPAGRALGEPAPREVARAKVAEGAAPGPVSPSLPSGASQAEALIREATELRRAGKDARAYPLLQKAYEAETTPRTAAQLGLVEMQLGYWLAAEQHLIEALSFPQDPWIASNRKSLEGSLETARAAIGEIVVTGKPDGATVLINGKPAGNLPMPAAIRVGSGPVKIEVRAAGFAPEHRSLTLHGGHRQEVAVALQNAGTAPPAIGSSAAPAAMASSPAPVQRAAPTAGDLAGDRPAPPLTRPLAWTSAGLAAGVLGFAGYQTSLWLDKRDQFGRHTAPARGPGQATTCGIREKDRGAPGCSTIFSDLEQSKKLAIAGYVAGGLLAAGAAALFVLSTGDGASGDLACAPSPGLPGGFCRIAF